MNKLIASVVVLFGVTLSLAAQAGMPFKKIFAADGKPLALAPQNHLNSDWPQPNTPNRFFDSILPLAITGWSEPERLAPLENNTFYLAGTPVFESESQALILTYNAGLEHQTLKAISGDAEKGLWNAPQNVASQLNYLIDPQIVSGSQTGTNIFFESVDADAYKIYRVQENSSRSWGVPSEVYQQSTLLQNINAAADSAGDIVMTFCQTDVGQGTAAAVYWNPSTQKWSDATPLSGPTQSALMPHLVTDKAGQNVYLVYASYVANDTGIYVHKFNVQSKSWSPQVKIPGSENLTFDLAGTGSQIPAAVDALGGLTVFWQSTAADKKTALYASYGVNMKFGAAHVLLAPEVRACDFYSFGSVAVNSAGKVLALLTSYEESKTLLYSFEFTPQGGWRQPQVVDNLGTNFVGRSRVSFIDETNAVSTFFANINGSSELASKLYDGKKWLPNRIALIGHHVAFFHEVAASHGHVVLSLHDMGATPAVQGIFGTFLK